MAKGKKRSTQGKKPSYSTYIHKVLKQVHNPLGISSKSMACINAIVEDVEERLTKEAVRYAKYAKKNTLSANHVQTAAMTILPGDLSGHAVSEGSRAVTKYFADAPKSG